MNEDKKRSKIYKYRLLIIIAGVILLAIVGFVSVSAYKNISEKPALQVEQQTNIIIPSIANPTEDTTSPMALPRGEFEDGDAVHSGTGDVQIVETSQGPILVFEENFKVTNGPDLLVYMSPNAADGALGEFASLGNLKSTSGKQAYNLPSNYRDYKTVVIWCRAFGVTFATAELK